jgi:hypothetical protein
MFHQLWLVILFLFCLSNVLAQDTSSKKTRQITNPSALGGTRVTNPSAAGTPGINNGDLRGNIDTTETDVPGINYPDTTIDVKTVLDDGKGKLRNEDRGFKYLMWGEDEMPTPKEAIKYLTISTFGLVLFIFSVFMLLKSNQFLKEINRFTRRYHFMYFVLTLLSFGLLTIWLRIFIHRGVVLTAAGFFSIISILFFLIGIVNLIEVMIFTKTGEKENIPVTKLSYIHTVLEILGFLSSVITIYLFLKSI